MASCSTLCFSPRRWTELLGWWMTALKRGHAAEYHSALSVVYLDLSVATNNANTSVGNNHKYLFVAPITQALQASCTFVQLCCVWLCLAVLDSAWFHTLSQLRVADTLLYPLSEACYSNRWGQTTQINLKFLLKNSTYHICLLPISQRISQDQVQSQ